MSKQNDLIKVGIKKGTFYISQDYPAPGEETLWEMQEFKNPQTGKDMVKFHKEISIVGSIVYLAMKESPFQGVGFVMSMIVAGENESYALEIPIMNANGSVRATNEYFNSLVGVFEKVEKGDKITMFVNNKNKDKNDRLYRNIVVLDEEGKLIKSDFSFKDVPNWESSTTIDDFGVEKKVWNPSPANKFFISKFKATSEKWESNRVAKKEETAKEEQPKKDNEAPAQTPVTKTPSKVAKPPVDDNHDLPF